MTANELVELILRITKLSYSYIQQELSLIVTIF